MLCGRVFQFKEREMSFFSVSQGIPRTSKHKSSYSLNCERNKRYETG